MTPATRVAVLRDGRTVQLDMPRTISRHPVNRFVAEFMGRPVSNTIDGMVTGGTFHAGTISCLVTRPDGPVTLGIRSGQITLCEAGTEGAIALAVEVMELIEPDTLPIL